MSSGCKQWIVPCSVYASYQRGLYVCEFQKPKHTRQILKHCSLPLGYPSTGPCTHVHEGAMVHTHNFKFKMQVKNLLVGNSRIGPCNIIWQQQQRPDKLGKSDRQHKVGLCMCMYLRSSSVRIRFNNLTGNTKYW